MMFLLFFAAYPQRFDILLLRTVQGMSKSKLPIHKSQSSHSGMGLFGRFHMGSRGTGDWSASDRESMFSNEGLHILDCVKSPVDRITIVSPQRQGDCRTTLLSVDFPTGDILHGDLESVFDMEQF